MSSICLSVVKVDGLQGDKHKQTSTNPGNTSRSEVQYLGFVQSGEMQCKDSPAASSVDVTHLSCSDNMLEEECLEMFSQIRIISKLFIFFSISLIHVRHWIIHCSNTPTLHYRIKRESIHIWNTAQTDSTANGCTPTHTHTNAASREINQSLSWATEIHIMWLLSYSTLITPVPVTSQRRGEAAVSAEGQEEEEEEEVNWSLMLCNHECLCKCAPLIVTELFHDFSSDQLGIMTPQHTYSTKKHIHQPPNEAARPHEQVSVHVYGTCLQSQEAVVSWPCRCWMDRRWFYLAISRSRAKFSPTQSLTELGTILRGEHVRQLPKWAATTCSSDFWEKFFSCPRLWEGNLPLQTSRVTGVNSPTRGRFTAMDRNHLSALCCLSPSRRDRAALGQSRHWKCELKPYQWEPSMYNPATDAHLIMIEIVQ